MQGLMLLQCVDHSGIVFGISPELQLSGGTSDDCITVITDEAQETPVDVNKSPIDDAADTHCRRIVMKGLREIIGRLQERCYHLLALANVFNDHNPIERFACRVPCERKGEMHPNTATVSVNIPFL